MPFPFINGDAFEYNKIINLLENESNYRIGFPGIGYPLLILFCEKINNSVNFFFFIQSVLQLFSVLLFYYNYKVYLKKYLLIVAVVLAGYLTSNVNLYYDTAYHPDSFLGSLFIVSIALFLRLIYNPSYFYFTILSFVIVFSISVRANGVVMIPLVFCYLIFIFISTRKIKSVLKYVGIFLIPTLLLCGFNFLSPIYKTFNIISFQSESTAPEGLYYNAKIVDTESEIWKKIENLNLDDYLYTDKIDRSSIFDDTTFAVLVTSRQRGLLIHQNLINELILENLTDSRNNWGSLNLDSILDCNNNEYQKFKIFFAKNYNKKKIIVLPPSNIKYGCMHFVGFYELFYKSLDIHGNVLGYENLSFYDENIKKRYGNCYSELKNDYNLKNKKRVYKELYALKKLSENNLLLKIDQDNWKMKVSKFNRWILHPFYKIQPILFRNFLFPIIFVVVFIVSFIGLFYLKWKSKILFFSVINALLLIITNWLFSFYFCYSYTRYTYQVSFMYYVSVILLPFIILEVKKIKIKLNSNVE